MISLLNRFDVASIGVPYSRTRHQCHRLSPLVLLGEPRNSTHLLLKELLEVHGLGVRRVQSGCCVMATVLDLKPAMVLLNESLADQSGTLVASKLLMTLDVNVWVYAKQPVSGLDYRVIHYGGSNADLVYRVHKHVVRWKQGLSSSSLVR